MADQLQDVEMPDGTVVSDVPVGTPKAEVMRRYMQGQGPSFPSAQSAMPAPMPPLAQPQAQQGAVGRFATAVGAKAADMLPGVLGGPGYAASAGIYQSGQDILNPPTTKQTGQRVLGGVGIDAQAVKNAALSRDYPSLAAETAVPVGMALAGGKLGRKIGSVTPTVEGLEQPSIPKPVAVAKLTQAIEPDPKLAPDVMKNLSTHLDTIHAAATKPINTLADLGEATAQAAANDPYRKSFIEPYRDMTVSTNYVRGYSGQEVSAGTATIGQLDQRLSQINDTLYPKFNKGGPGSQAAQAAIGSEQASGLMSEANSIRNALAENLSKRTGIDAQVIRDARGRFGQLNDLASKINRTVEERAAQQRLAQNTPLTVKDLNPKDIPLNPKNWFGNVPDRVVQQTMRNYRPK